MAKTYSKQDEHKNRKLIFGFIALFAAAVVIIGVGYAYFSDVITGDGTATAGTLDIDGTVGILQNGSADGITNGAITNLNPGDVISFDASGITNAGSKSAWIRQVLTFSTLSSTNNTASNAAATSMVGNLADWLWVCTGGTATQGQLKTAFNSATRTGGVGTATTVTDSSVTAGTATCAKAALNAVFGAKSTYTLVDDVIQGSAETDGNATWASTNLPIIYFDHLAPNTAQNGTAAFAVKIQALQYRNNTTSPTETQWSTVVDVPFALN